MLLAKPRAVRSASCRHAHDIGLGARLARLPLPPPAASRQTQARQARCAAAADYRCWTNPSGAVLTELVPGAVWAAERAFLWNKIDVGGRSVVLRLADGTLWVHSPVALDEPLRAALAALGPVRHVVAPNFEHLKHTAAWLQAYPEATGYGCPGLREQRPELGLHADALQAPWRDEIQPLHLGFERNPFSGKPFFQELLFFHAATGTALVTDFAWNYPEEKGRLPAGSKLWKFGMDVVYGPFYRRWMVADRAACARARDAVAAWPVKALVPCHGDVLRGEEARQALLANFTPP